MDAGDIGEYKRLSWLLGMKDASSRGKWEAMIPLGKLALASGAGATLNDWEQQIADVALAQCAMHLKASEASWCAKVGARDGCKMLGDAGFYVLGTLGTGYDMGESGVGAAMMGLDAEQRVAAWPKLIDFCDQALGWGLLHEPKRITELAKDWIMEDAPALALEQLIKRGLDWRHDVEEAPEVTGSQGSEFVFGKWGVGHLAGSALMGPSDGDRGRPFGWDGPWNVDRYLGTHAQRLGRYMDRLGALAKAGAPMDEAGIDKSGAPIGAFAYWALMGPNFALEPEVVELLASHGADIEMPSPSGPSAVWLLSNGRRLVPNYRAGIDRGMSVMDRARALARACHKAGAKMDRYEDADGDGRIQTTPLYEAMSNGSWEWALALLELGANPQRGGRVNMGGKWVERFKSADIVESALERAGSDWERSAMMAVCAQMERTQLSQEVPVLTKRSVSSPRM